MSRLKRNFEPAHALNLFKYSQRDGMYKLMQNTFHDGDSLNDYSLSHAESSVWAHTIAVLSNLLRSKEEVTPELFFAGVFHDIGKVFTRGQKEVKSEDPNEKSTFKTTFYGHQNLSSMMVMDMLYSMYDTGFLSGWLDLQRIIDLINLHMFFSFDFGKYYEGKYYLSKKEIDKVNLVFGDDRDLYCDLLQLILADSLGRVTKRSEYAATWEKHKTLTKLIDDLQFPYVDKRGAPKAIFFIGMPGSGKTSFRKNYPGYTIISQDDMIMEEAERLGIPYNAVFDEDEVMKKVSERLLATISDASKERKNFVVDMTNLSLKSRRAKLANIHHSYEKKAVVFMRPLFEILEVNDKRKESGRDVPLEAIYNMAKGFHVPTGFEFDSVKYRFFME